MNKLKKGTDVEGLKVVSFACRCGHKKSQHVDEEQEVCGKRIKEGDKYVIPVTIRKIKNNGKCKECSCFGYVNDCVELSDGNVYNTYKSLFLCRICDEWKFTKNKKLIRDISADIDLDDICNKCLLVYINIKIKETQESVDLLTELKSKYENTPIYSLNTLVGGYYGGYDFKEVDISMADLIDALLESLNKTLKDLRKIKI